MVPGGVTDRGLRTAWPEPPEFVIAFPEALRNFLPVHLKQVRTPQVLDPDHFKLKSLFVCEVLIDLFNFILPA